MVKETNRDRMRMMLESFSKNANKYYGSYAYSSGYFEATVLGMFTLLPKKIQQSYIEEFILATQEQEKRLICKVLTEDAESA